MATQQGLPVSKLINVSVTLTPTAAQGTDLNSAMIVGDSNVIDTTSRYRSYSSIEEIATDFGTTAPEYLASELFFSQNPQPTQLYIGRWAETATPGELFGGPVSVANQLPGAWTGVTSGAFFTTIDGVPYSAAGMNFSSVSNMNGVATVIGTELNVLDTGATCVWNSVYERFEFASPTTGSTSSFGFIAPPTANGYYSFSGQPSPTDTITVNGTVVTYIASGADSSEINIGSDEAHTIANTLAYLSASADANIAKMTYSVVGTKLYCTSKATGTPGNAYTLAETSSAISVSGGNLTGGSGTDISALITATSTSSGAYVASGVNAESALAATIILDSLNVSWYGLAFAAGTNNVDFSDASALAVAAYIEAASNHHLLGLTTSEGAAILPNDTTSLGALIKAAGYKRSFAQYSSTNPYAAVSMLGRGVTVNFDGSDTTINFQWQQEPGVVAENLSSGQSSNLDANNYNYYANFANDTAIIVNGKVASGHFIDEIWNSDWFGDRIQTDLFNLLFTAGTKIPQTDAGMHLLATTMQSSCDAAVNNGFLGPGIWNSAGFGQLVEGQYIPKGYYIYQPPVALQSQSARAARKSVAFQIAAKEAGAVNDVMVSVIVNQ